MNSKFNFKSVRFKIWIYFLVIVVVILFLNWFLQIFFMNNYYDKMKIISSEKKAALITDVYNNSDNSKEFIDGIQNILSSDDIYLQIEHKGNPVYSSDSRTEGYQAELDQARDSLNEAAPDKSDIALTLVTDKTQRETWVYAGYLDASHDTAMYLLSPLYPVGTTVEIMQNQLVYITLGSLIFGLLFAVYASIRIARPIDDINKKAKNLAKGDYGITFPTRYSYSEINELAQTLNKASSELERSSNLQRDIVANVSHDLRTPLTMVKSYAEMIRDLSGDNPEKRNAHLQIIIDEADRLNSLVNDLMTLSDVQAGTLQLNIERFSIKGLFDSVLQPYGVLQQKEGYSIVFNCRQDVEVIGDSERIKQVVANLLSNAVKYCGDDKKIFINVKKWGKRVHCEVVDHGPGIKASELPYIWERYYKSSNNHVRASKSSGLGLSIVKEILTAHNARFGVESKVGRGTTFWFELEVAPEPKASKGSRHGLLHRSH